MQNNPSTKVFTTQFWLLGLSSFLFSSSVNMLIPELPAHLSAMGGKDYKGLIIGLFTITAGISRPFSGRLTDKIGRLPVMIFGSLVCFVCGFFYPIFYAVVPFLALRLIHGFSTGFKPTGTSAYVADIVPVNRRGEAMGVHGMCMSTGAAFGPAIGSTISNAFSINFLFYTSSALALLSIVILVNMKETLAKKEALSLNSFRLTRRDIFEPDVWKPALITFLIYFGFGAVLTLTPDFSKFLGLSNRGIYFMIFTLSSILVRIFAGKLSDKKGRIPVTVIGCMVLVLSMLVTGFATDTNWFFTGAILFGIAMGILSPVLSAWTIDLSTDQNRGRAIASMYISLEAGVGIGAVISAALYHNQFAKIPLAFSVMGGFALLSLLFCLYFYYQKKKEVYAVR